VASVHQALVLVGLGCLLVLCAGLIVRGKVTQCLTFSIYIAAATMFTALFVINPASNTPELYLIKQGIYDCLLFGVALELAYKTFAAFRGIAAKVRGCLAALVGLSSALVFFLTPGSKEYSALGTYQPGITTAGLWCLTFVALLIVWYQIPVPAYTRAIILGYVPYLVVFVVCIDLIGLRGWSVVPITNLFNAAAYDVAVGYLAYSGWRKD
jgi:hypothetical protein